MNACPESAPRQNPWPDPVTPRQHAHWGPALVLHRLAWHRQHGGRCSSGPGAVDDRCPEHPAYHPVAGLGDLVEAADLWLHAVPDGTVGRVVYAGDDIDGIPGIVIAWTTGRSTTHAAPLRLPRAAGPDGWAADLVGDPRWTLNPARRPKLERAP